MEISSFLSCRGSLFLVTHSLIKLDSKLVGLIDSVGSNESNETTSKPTIIFRKHIDDQDDPDDSYISIYSHYQCAITILTPMLEFLK